MRFALFCRSPAGSRCRRPAGLDLPALCHDRSVCVQFCSWHDQLPGSAVIPPDTSAPAASGENYDQGKQLQARTAGGARRDGPLVREGSRLIRHSVVGGTIPAFSTGGTRAVDTLRAGGAEILFRAAQSAILLSFVKKRPGADFPSYSLVCVGTPNPARPRERTNTVKTSMTVTSFLQ